MRRFVPEVAILRAKADPERDNPLLEEMDAIRCVRFGLLICWINVQLPNPLPGSPRAQGLRHTSLTGWSNSHFSKDVNEK